MSDLLLLFGLHKSGTTALNDACRLSLPVSPIKTTQEHNIFDYRNYELQASTLYFENSPEYFANLSSLNFESMSKTFEKVTVLILIRHPVSRFVSEICMHMDRGIPYDRALEFAKRSTDLQAKIDLLKKKLPDASILLIKSDSTYDNALASALETILSIETIDFSLKIANTSADRRNPLMKATRSASQIISHLPFGLRVIQLLKYPTIHALRVLWPDREEASKNLPKINPTDQEVLEKDEEYYKKLFSKRKVVQI